MSVLENMPETPKYSKNYEMQLISMNLKANILNGKANLTRLPQSINHLNCRHKITKQRKLKMIR